MSTRSQLAPPGPEVLGSPLAAAALVALFARWAPLSFAYRENDLGIVSATTLARYPTQQETIWFALCGGLGIVLVWRIAARWAGRRLAPERVLVVEALAALAAVAALALPRLPATATALALLGAAFACAERFAGSAAPVAAVSPGAGAGRTRAGWIALWAALALLHTPRFWIAVPLVAAGVPDAEVTHPGWAFQMELGQHLAWGDALWRGELHGRDFFCLYGPLYDWLGVGFWHVFGRSIAAWHLYDALAELLGLAALALVTAQLVRRPVWVALSPLLPVALNLRVGLPLFGLAALLVALRRERIAPLLAAGVAAGLGLLYSQEFALAFVCAAALAFAVHGALRPVLAFAAGAVCVMAPVLGAYAAAGALSPLLRDLGGYPALVLAGYGNLPFPSLLARLPLSLPFAADDETLVLRVGLGCAALGVAAVGLALPRHPGLARPLAWLREARARLVAEPRTLAVLLVGGMALLSFRSALGRSDPFHVQMVQPLPMLLVLAAADRIADAATGGGRARTVAAARGVLLAAVLAATGLLGLSASASLYFAQETLAQIGRLVSDGPGGVGAHRVNQVARFVREETAPDDAVLFLPNNPAYLYLTARRNPIRFAASHQIATDAHRAEALADLRRDPPRLVVWDDAQIRIDDVPDEVVMGEALVAWIDAHYTLLRRFGSVRVLARTEAP